MDIRWNTELYCLIGNPIDNSLSPKLHNNIYKSLGLNKIYLAFNINEDDLEIAVNGLKSIGVKGFNVTIPFKKEIMKYLDKVDSTAEIIGAVNTVKNENGKLIGYNTDGPGFIQSFYDNSINIKGKNILLLGSGGAAYGIGAALAMEDVKSISIANRTIENANDLKNKIKETNKTLEINVYDLNLDKLNKDNIDIIINTTSVGMYPMEDMAPIGLNGFKKDTVVYDIIYKPQTTKLLEEANSLGFRTINGISMLINQGIISQEIWLDLKDKNNLKNIQKNKGILDLMSNNNI